MTTMLNDTASLMRIRTGEGVERREAGTPRPPGELAGQFAAMLEQLNGVDAGAGDGAQAGAASLPIDAAGGTWLRAPEGDAATPCLGVGAVSLFAQSVAEEEVTVPLPAQPEEALEVVESALKAGGASDFRWLTTLLTQGVPEAADGNP